MLDAVKRPCLVCGEPIKSTRPDAFYCSTLCGNRSRGKKYRELNKDKIKIKNAQENSIADRRILIRVKSRAKQNNIPFDLSVEDIVIPEFCPVLGLKLRPNSGRQGYYPDSPSLDRIYPEKGYIKGNVRVISNRANLLKNDATVEELEAVLSDLKGIRDG